MKPRFFLTPFATTLAILLVAGGCFAAWTDTLKDTGSKYLDDGATGASLPYSLSEANLGIKEVLRLGTKSAVSTLGKKGGFSKNPAFSISLPDALKGLAGNSSGLVSSFNSVAESVVPSAGNIFLEAIKGLDIKNPLPLISGGKDAITRFFEKNSRGTLKSLIKPIVSGALDQTGTSKYLTPLTAAQESAGLAEPLFDMSDYVTDQTLDSMFTVMTAKEQDLRTNRGGQTSDIIKKLF